MIMRHSDSSDDIIGSPRRLGAIVIGVVASIFIVIALVRTMTTVDAGEIVVKQNALDGDLQIWTTPGLKFQNFGSIEAYPQSAQYWFESQSTAGEGEEQKKDSLEQCLHIRFNDQGTAKLCGSVSWEMPMDAESIVKLHTKFRSHEAIEQRLIKPALDKAIYNSGPLMSSHESASDRRSELIAAIRDMTVIGVYRVEVEQEEVPDLFANQIEVIELVEEPALDAAGTPILDEKGQPKMELKPKKVMRRPMKKVKIVKPRMGADGKVEIAEASTVSAYGIRLFNFTINRIIYDDRVQKQIAAQQEATMAIQTALAHAQRAEQDAVTAKAEGDAKIAITKATQEVAKQEQVTQAESRRAVATEDLETSRLKAEAVKIEADADAYKKKQVILADGALDKKLAAAMKIHEFWANAAAHQRLVPEVQMGGSSGGGGATGVHDLMNITAARAAQELALDLKVDK
jgi:regulator of protease activity HflC (stomatin/prohibitin superfamily)